MKATKRLKITKDDIIEAIYTEPLRYGMWLQADAECSVCACGALLRRAGIADDDIPHVANAVTVRGDIVGSDRALRIALGEKKWLNALSIKFESLGDSYSPATIEQRRELARWVNKVFPRQFTVSWRG